MRIYDRIRNLCKEKGIAVTQMEKELGFSRGSISKIDKHKPSNERIQKIATFLGVSVGYLMDAEEPKVQISGLEKEYYIDQDTADLAQEMFNNPELRALFDAAKGAKPEYLISAAQLLKTLKETNIDG